MQETSQIGISKNTGRKFPLLDDAREKFGQHEFENVNLYVLHVSSS
jgi:hypothetical protein